METETLKELNESETIKGAVVVMFTDAGRVAFVMDAARRIASAVVGRHGSGANVDPRDCFDLAERLWAESVKRYGPGGGE